jgi:hypothetical protein
MEYSENKHALRKTFFNPNNAGIAQKFIEDFPRQDRRNLNVRNLLSFYIRSLTLWQDHGECARYPFNSMNLLNLSLFVLFT